MELPARFSIRAQGLLFTGPPVTLSVSEKRETM